MTTTDHASALAAAEEAARIAAAEVDHLRAELAAELEGRQAHGPDSAALARELGRTAADGVAAARSRHPRTSDDGTRDDASTTATGGRRHTTTDAPADDDTRDDTAAAGIAEARRRLAARRSASSAA